MRQIVAAEYLSLDGVGEDPGRIGAFERRGWMIPYHDDELATYMAEQLFASDTLLLGRTTYEGFVSVWPVRSGDPIAERMNSLRKFVVSTTLNEPLEWNATLLSGDLGEAARELKRQPGRNILVYGSGTLVYALMQLDLIDVYQLMLVPVALGRGERFFKDRDDTTFLSLIDVRTTRAGVVMLTYHRAPRDRPRSGTVEHSQGDWWLSRPR